MARTRFVRISTLRLELVLRQRLQIWRHENGEVERYPSAWSRLCEILLTSYQDDTTTSAGGISK